MAELLETKKDLLHLPTRERRLANRVLHRARRETLPLPSPEKIQHTKLHIEDGISSQVLKRCKATQMPVLKDLYSQMAENELIKC